MISLFLEHTFFVNIKDALIYSNIQKHATFSLVVSDVIAKIWPVVFNQWLVVQPWTFGNVLT